MDGPQVFASWDTILLAVPFAALLMMAMFGLDERLAAHRTQASKRRPFCSPDATGEILLCDPDGRLWNDSGKKVSRFAAPRNVSTRWYAYHEDTGVPKPDPLA